MVRVRADHMGMLATTINALAVADVLEQHGVQVRVQTAIEMRQIAEPLSVPRHPAPGEGQSCGLWLRNGKSLFLNRYGSGAPCGGDRRRCDPAG